MRILSWNVQGLKKSVEPRTIGAALLDHAPSLIVLQEYRPGPRGTALNEFLSNAGFAPYAPPAKAWPFRTIIFAPTGAHVMPAPTDLAVDDPFWIELRFGKLAISAVHIPLQGFDTEWRKSHWQGALSLTTSVGEGLHVLIGDLNTTRHGIDEIGTSVPGDHYLSELEAAGWVEAWRERNPNLAVPEYTWYHHRGNGFRIDQAWLSPALAPRLIDARLDHNVREAKLSDHSMLIVDLNLE